MKKKVSLLVVCALVVGLMCNLTGCKPKEETPVETPNVSAPVESQVPETEKSVEGIVTSLKNFYGERYLLDVELGSEELESIMGITEDMYSDFYGALPMIGTHLDALYVVKCNEGYQDEVKEKFETRRNQQIEEGRQYPINVGRVESSQVLEYEDYVIYFMLGGVPEVDLEEGDLVKYYADQEEAGIAVLDSYFHSGEVYEGPVYAPDMSNYAVIEPEDLDVVGEEEGTAPEDGTSKDVTPEGEEVVLPEDVTPVVEVQEGVDSKELE